MYAPRVDHTASGEAINYVHLLLCSTGTCHFFGVRRPHNSWDRQPYWTFSGVVDGFNDPAGRSFLKARDIQTRNFMINGACSFYCLIGIIRRCVWSFPEWWKVIQSCTRY